MSDSGIIFLLEDGRLAGPHVYIARMLKHLPGKNKVLIPEDSNQVQELFDEYKVDYETTFFLSRLSREPLRILRYFIFFIPEIIFLAIFLLKSNQKTIYCAGGSWQIKGAISGFFARKKVIWHLNDTYSPFVIRFIFSYLSYLADGYIFASKATKKYYENLIYQRSRMVIQAPVDEIKFGSIAREYDLSKKNLITIGTVCNINPLKNLEDFIEIARDLNMMKKYNLSFKVFGPTFKSQQSYKNKLMELVDEYDVQNIEFCGPSDRIHNDLEKMDIFLFTSKSESSPISIWEAMMSGLPVATYKVGDVDDYIIDGENGFTAEVFDWKKLSLSISSLIDKNLSYKISLESKKVAEKYFSSKNCAKLHIEYIQKFID